MTTLIEKLCEAFTDYLLNQNVEPYIRLLSRATLEEFHEFKSAWLELAENDEQIAQETTQMRLDIMTIFTNDRVSLEELFEAFRWPRLVTPLSLEILYYKKSANPTNLYEAQMMSREMSQEEFSCLVLATIEMKLPCFKTTSLDDRYVEVSELLARPILEEV